MWRLEAGGVFFGRTPWKEEEGGKVCRLKFFCKVQEPQRFTELLHLSFVYFWGQEEGGGWKVSGWWEKATLSPVWGCSCILPNCLVKGTFVLQWNISPFTPLDAVSPRFSFLRKTLSLQARVTDPPPLPLPPFRVDGKLMISKLAMVIKWKGWSKRLKI